jgi:hypothetical protein
MLSCGAHSSATGTLGVMDCFVVVDCRDEMAVVSPIGGLPMTTLTYDNEPQNQ